MIEEINILKPNYTKKGEWVWASNKQQMKGRNKEFTAEWMEGRKVARCKERKQRTSRKKRDVHWISERKNGKLLVSTRSADGQRRVNASSYVTPSRPVPTEDGVRGVTVVVWPLRRSRSRCFASPRRRKSAHSKISPRLASRERTRQLPGYRGRRRHGVTSQSFGAGLPVVVKVLSFHTHRVAQLRSFNILTAWAKVCADKTHTYLVLVCLSSSLTDLVWGGFHQLLHSSHGVPSCPTSDVIYIFCSSEIRRETIQLQAGKLPPNLVNTAFYWLGPFAVPFQRCLTTARDVNVLANSSGRKHRGAGRVLLHCERVTVNFKEECGSGSDTPLSLPHSLTLSYKRVQSLLLRSPTKTLHFLWEMPPFFSLYYPFIHHLVAVSLSVWWLTYCRLPWW